jgi:hypothetical protein
VMMNQISNKILKKLQEANIHGGALADIMHGKIH